MSATADVVFLPGEQTSSPKHIRAHRTPDVRDLFRPLVDEQNHQFDIRMILLDGAGNFLQEWIVLPAFGGATISARWPSPMGAIKSSSRMEGSLGPSALSSVSRLFG